MFKQNNGLRKYQSEHNLFINYVHFTGNQSLQIILVTCFLWA